MKKRLLFLLFITIFSSKMSANECDNKLFSLSAYKHNNSALSIKDILLEISTKCHISISFNDTQSKKAINKKLDFINIQDYSFEQFLNFLFDEANLFYTYDKKDNRIILQETKSRTFNVDYINITENTSQNSKSVSSSAASSMGSSGSSYGGGSSYTSGGSGMGTTGSNNNQNDSSNDYTTIITKSEFNFWNSLKENIQKLFKNPQKVKIFINQDASMITVNGTKRDLERVEKFLNQLMKKMHKQVMIEAKIIELTYDDSSSTGIDWSQLGITLSGSFSNEAPRPTYNVTYSFATDRFLRFLKSYGDVKVLSNPKILTLNNQPAVINVGQQLSYKFQTGSVTTTGGTAAGTNTYSIGSTFIGITLYVIPEVGSDGEIIMKINPVISKLNTDQEDVVAPQTTTLRELPPDTKIKQMTSIVKVKDGQKIVLGGLVSVSKGTTNIAVPVLGDIPLVNLMFKKDVKIKQRSEMFIVLMPHIINDDSRAPSIDEILNDSFFDTNTTE